MKNGLKNKALTKESEMMASSVSGLLRHIFFILPAANMSKLKGGNTFKFLWEKNVEEVVLNNKQTKPTA